MRAWAALRPSSVESRFEALHASGVTELVGREEELELLLRRWSKAKTGEGQVVLLSGEAGIGKSRLTAALLERLAAEPHTRLRYFCSPQRTDSAFFPIISQMERAAGFAQDDTVQAKLDKLDALMAQSHTPRQDIALFADMLSLPNDGRYPTADLTPQQRRQKTLEALRGPVETFAGKKPVLMILEDAHWADPTSLEVFSRCCGSDASPPRPADHNLSTGVRAAVDRTAARQRPHSQSADAARSGRDDRPDHWQQATSGERQARHHRADRWHSLVRGGNDQGGAGSGERKCSAAHGCSHSVPGGGGPSDTARLADGAARPAGRSRQGGCADRAAIGREFSHTLLAAVARKPEAELEAALDRTIAAGLLFRQGVPPHATYLFKHVLVQDAAYGTLLREPRRALHARIAETLESQFAEIAENQPEVLARHCTEAGLSEKAAGLWGKAGQRSLARAALVEAVAQLTRALDQSCEPCRLRLRCVASRSSFKSR